MPFEFISTMLDGVILIEPKSFADNRGEFSELFKQSEFVQNGIDKPFVQTNFSVSNKGVLRGLHFQKDPNAQAKLVYVVSGSAFDVAVDIRKDSPYYGKWISVTLSSEKRNMIYIPEGFAHGFMALEDNTKLTYNCTAEYSPEHEGGLVWNDPAIGIKWPIAELIVIERDAQFPTLEQL
jgi:dTDP-4-dehydrorhamnose 3,5-epimerase